MKDLRAFYLDSVFVDPADHSVQINDQEKSSLQPKFIEVLCYLANQFPRVVERQEIIDKVWGENSYVGEKALTNTIWHLRKTLHTDNSSETIKTIRKAGYQLVIEPKWVKDNSDQTITTIPNQEHIRISNSSQPQINSGFVQFKSYFPYVLFLIVAVYLSLHLYNEDNSLQAMQIEQITKEPGSELFSAPSPDGRYVVYQWSRENEDYNLYVTDRLQPSLPPEQLTFDSALEGFSVWSNDSKYLYFARKTSKPKQCEIIRLDVSLKTELSIGKCARSGRYYYIALSPDNTRLAYLDSGESKGISFIDLTDPEFKSTRFSCSQNCQYRDRDMTFSPDGKTLAVTRRAHRFDENIYLINIADNSEQQITFNEADIVGLTWHPEGRYIVYATQRSDQRHGFIYDLELKKRISLDINGFSYPEFSSITGELFFQQRVENYEVSSVALDSVVASGTFPVLHSKFNHLQPDYSKEQNRLAYISNESGSYEVWTAKTDGSNRERLTSLNQFASSPKWSHDGSKVAFLASSPDGSGDNIYIVDFHTKKVSKVETDYSQHNNPTWTLDDKHIISAVYDERFVDLFKFSIDQKNGLRLTFSGGRFGQMINQEELIFAPLSGGLYLTSLNDLEQTQLLLATDSFNATYSWVYHNNTVFFNQEDDDAEVIYSINLSDKTRKAVFKLPKKSMTDQSSVAIGENKIYFTRAYSSQSDIHKLNHPLWSK
ncbi:winged helix-turn-helix domain-containing protein [Thalassomonas sp. M1454]|uniref:winged helix-turn-helix domain-containing protein n=1 Tax=Thalassomonas sp. M1454 TaxID=2594477 RepID=UPI0011807EC0|nr:winged helix-turn-helix domain-containing protein [Thalassomonas sp. M1454]TRX55809.1 winged helix-turn-helix transcriptional regulator [Thalassomonas sp. M1454]